MGSSASSNPSPQNKITQNDRIIADLKSQMAKLDRYRKMMESKTADETKAIKQLLNEGKRSKAMSLLKLKKLRESNLEKSQISYHNLEQLVLNIETAQQQQEVLKGLQLGNETLKALNNIMSIDAVEALLDDTQEAIEHQQEIDRLLASNLSDNDEEELEKELEELKLLYGEQQTVDKQIEPEDQNLEILKAIPVPSHPIGTQTSNDDLKQLEELNQLEELEKMRVPENA